MFTRFGNTVLNYDLFAMFSRGTFNGPVPLRQQICPVIGMLDP
jgi:hypothetical protein